VLGMCGICGPRYRRRMVGFFVLTVHAEKDPNRLSISLIWDIVDVVDYWDDSFHSFDGCRLKRKVRDDCECIADDNGKDGLKLLQPVKHGGVDACFEYDL
jgi:hypothetical protein